MSFSSTSPFTVAWSKASGSAFSSCSGACGSRGAPPWSLPTRDVALARLVADYVVVLDYGKAVETGPTGSVLDAPRHPCTKSLVGEPVFA